MGRRAPAKPADEQVVTDATVSDEDATAAEAVVTSDGTPQGDDTQTDDTAPTGDESTETSDATVSDEDATAARKAALANLAAGTEPSGGSGEGGGPIPTPPAIDPSGKVCEWGGETPYLVTAHRFAWVHPETGAVRFAYRGDVIKITNPERGLQVGALTEA